MRDRSIERRAPNRRIEAEGKDLGQGTPAFGGDGQGAAPALALDPVPPDNLLAERRPERPGDVPASLAPIEAGPQEGAPRSLDAQRIDAEIGEEGGAGLGHLAAIGGEHDMA